MARYSKNSPFFSKKIRILAGSACYADLAVASGCIWDPCELEHLFDGNCEGFSGKYRKMPTGVVPKTETCEHIQGIEENANLFYWRDLPLWILLSEHLIGTEQYNRLLDDAWDPEDEKHLLSNHAFLNHEGEIFREHTWYGLADIKDRNFASIESLILHTARLRRAIDNDLLPLVCRYSVATLYILDKLIYKTPQLYIRWPLLVEIYRNDLWPIKVPEFRLELELSFILKYLDYTNPKPSKYTSRYPPKHMHRRMNQQYLKYIYDQ